MARKRVNKNLVAFLTVMAILLTVVVVAIATRRGARKDPEVWARQAREREQAGDFRFALELYNRAYEASQHLHGGVRDVAYLVELAACAYRFGETGLAISTLAMAYAQQPRNQMVLVEYLERMWDLFLYQHLWALPPVFVHNFNILEYTDRLQEVDPDNVLGPVTTAVVYWILEREDPANRLKGEAAMQRAIELDQNDPRVVLARISWEARLMAERRSAAEAAGALAVELEEIAREFRERSMAILHAGMEARPGEWRLLGSYLDALQQDGRMEEARAALERALAVDETDPEVQHGMARFLWQEAMRTRAELAPEVFQQKLQQAFVHARRAVELEPALYDAYVLQAQIEMSRGLTGPEVTAIPPECYEAALQTYDAAIRDTVGVHSVFATRGQELRQIMHIRAFNTATEYWAQSAVPSARQERLNRWVRRFLEAAEARYPERPFTYFIRGQTHAMEGDTTSAILAFRRAQELAGAEPMSYPRMWMQAFAGRLPHERLAVLSRDAQQPGESLRYTDEALAQYQDIFGWKPGDHTDPPPQYLMLTRHLALNRAELLNILGRAQEALDYVADLRRLYRDHWAETVAADVPSAVRSEQDRLRLAAIEATALQELGRGDEIREVLVDQADTAAALLLRAQLAERRGDTAALEARVRELMAYEDLTPRQAFEALALLIERLLHEGRQTDGKPMVEMVRQRFGAEPALQMPLQRLEILVSYADPEQRDAELLKLIKAEPDPVERARQFYEFHARRGEYEQAAAYLDQLEQRRPDDTLVLERQFVMALHFQKHDRARQYVIRLGRLDADRAGGAVYRGRLHLAQGEPVEAVREFRAAKSRLPPSVQLQVLLAQALLSEGRIDEALPELLEAVHLNPRDFLANKLLYQTYQALPPERQPEDGGMSYLRQAAELNPRDPYIAAHKEFLDEQDRPQEGIKRRESIRARDPQNIENLVRLAQLYAQVGQLAQATEIFREALGLDPGDGNLARVATTFYAQTGRRQEGEEHLAAFLAAQSGPGRGLAYGLLGRFYERLRDLEAAEGAFQRAQQEMERVVEDPEQRRLLVVQAAFDLIDFYARNPGREATMVDVCRWVQDKLRARDEWEAALIQRARLLAIRGLLGLERYGDAETELDAYTQAYPNDVAGLVSQAQLKLLQRDWEGAYRALSQTLQADPEHSWALLYRGRVASRYARYTEARQDLIRARALAKTALDRLPAPQRRGSPEERFYLSVCSELAGLFEVTGEDALAEIELREMMELVADRPIGTITQAQLADRLIKLHRDAGRWKRAQDVISEFMNRYPQSAYWPLQHGLLAADQADEMKRLAKAAAEQGRAAEERRYHAASAEQSATAAVYFHRAEQLAGEGDPAMALQCFAFRLDALAAAGQAEEAMRLFEQRAAQTRAVPAIVHAAMIHVCMKRAREDQAVSHLQRALEISCQESSAAVNAVLGFATEHLSRETAVATLEQLVARVPADAVLSFRLRNNLAELLLGAQQSAEALRVLEPVVTYAAAKSGERLMALLLRSQSLEQSGDNLETIELLEQVLQEYPGNSAALNNLAFLLADRLGRAQEGLQYAEQARELDPRNASILDTLGWVYFKLGRYEQAEAALKEAVNLRPEAPAPWYHLGVLYLDRGRVTDARTHLRRALDKAIESENQEYQRKAQEALGSAKTRWTGPPRLVASGRPTRGSAATAVTTDVGGWPLPALRCSVASSPGGKNRQDACSTGWDDRLADTRLCG